jgi:rhodanese-related sulfurtransferase/transcriptional regulator with XRE-family HTH domain
MVKTVGPREAEALIAAGEIDVIDVREPSEWDTGHVPGARNVPLDQVKKNARGTVNGDRALFICARGARSLTAAETAERAGIQEIYSLDGGTLGWESAGLPLERAPRPTRTTLVSEGEEPRPADASCGLPEPGLDIVVGANLRALRSQRKLSLDALAELTGVSRTVLGQIELGRTPPSVSVVWKIARAFDVPFSALLATTESTATSVLRAAQAKRLVSPDGRFSSRALYPLGDRPAVEFYELYLGPHSREDAQPHQPGTRENLIVTTGRLELTVGDVRYELAKGDAIVFGADVAHAYVNPSSEECWMYLVMTYTQPAAEIAAGP